MILLGLSGKKQSGKDTVASYIEEALRDWAIPLEYKQIGFADALYKEVAKALSPMTAEQEKIKFIKEHKDNFRLILQGWGTDYRRKLLGDDYWIKRWLTTLSTLPNNTFVVCNDCRFLNEYECIKQLQAPIWRIHRTPGYIDSHVSETELDDAKFDMLIRNNSSLADLRQSTRNYLLALLELHKLK